MTTSGVDPHRSTVTIDGKEVEILLRVTRSARRLRIRVGAAGVEVIRPEGSDTPDAEAFVRANGPWVIAQLDRVTRLSAAQRLHRIEAGTILLRGAPTRVRVEEVPYPRRSNRVKWRNNSLIVVIGRGSSTAPDKTLERWLRGQARIAIREHVATLVARIDVSPGRLYIMDQRTKWGSCSSLGNLSFNWRIIMAPEHVLRYLVTHETVHLAIPDHSLKFWLTVQSICPDTDGARQWLAANGESLLVDLTQVLRRPEADSTTPSMSATGRLAVD